jgi:O-antigen ligase
MVRLGILGVISYMLAVLVPLYFCFKLTTSNQHIVSRTALMGSCFLICQIVAGFSDEFLNLKGMVTFYAYLISALLSTALSFSNLTHQK